MECWYSCLWYGKWKCKFDDILILWCFSGWTKLEAIDSLMRKAGYNGVITESVRQLIRLTRYQSTAFTMHYGEYIAYVKNTRGTVPNINGLKPGNY